VPPTTAGPLTTTGANELLFAANLTTGWTNTPGAGFTSRVITSPDSDIAEDRVVASRAPTAELLRAPESGSCRWWRSGACRRSLRPRRGT